jgi:hypothetical protein
MLLTRFTGLNVRHLVACAANVWSDERLLGVNLRSKQHVQILRNSNEYDSLQWQLQIVTVAGSGFALREAAAYT